MNRREVLMAGGGLALGGVAGPLAAFADARPWRTFELVTRVEVIEASGLTRAWIPMPLAVDTDWQRRVDQVWTGNAPVMRVHHDDEHGAAIFFAEWPAGEAAPVAEVTTRIATRDRAVDLTAPGSAPPEDPKVLERYLRPSRFIRTDGIVRETALAAIGSRTAPVDRARAIYDWIVDHTFRDPKVKGCGLGDISTMLETGNLGGKCADLNGLFVGMARSVGVPARELYGVRVAPSAEFGCLGKSGDVTKGQHCRAEFYAPGLGWVPIDAADVRKVVLEEDGGLPLDHPKVKRARDLLFGSVEMNWLAYNTAADPALPGWAGDPPHFFLYPQAETGGARRDCLEPESVRYRLTSRELA